MKSDKQKKLSAKAVRDRFDYDPVKGILVYRSNGIRYRRGQKAGSSNGRGALNVSIRGHFAAARVYFGEFARAE